MAQIPGPEQQVPPPFLAPAHVQRRRSALGFGGSKSCSKLLAEFEEGTEFIGLGCSCVTSYGLQALGFKKRTYPLDWLRSPMDGLIHLLETDFEDFLTFTEVKASTVPGEKATYSSTRWGGSFWHHDVTDKGVATAFHRRIERLLGLTDEVDSAMRRVFVRAVNSTRELDMAQRLHETLCQLLPGCQILLLLLVDLQIEEGLLRTAALGDSVLVYRIRDDIFAEDYTKWTMDGSVENYARGISRAVAHWAGVTDKTEVKMFDGFAQLNGSCDQMDGGCTASTTFWPRRFLGQKLQLRKSKMLPKLLRDPVGIKEQPFGLPSSPSGAVAGEPAKTSMAPARISVSSQRSMPLVNQSANASIDGKSSARASAKIADLEVPRDISPGTWLGTQAFGKEVRFQLPQGAVGGQHLQLSELGGVVTVAVFAAAVTSAATVAAAAMAASRASSRASSRAVVPASTGDAIVRL